MSTDRRMVPKVHPATREIAAHDPMELFATPALGDPEVMLECIVQEFAGMGCDQAQLSDLFHSPFYPVLSQLRACLGEAEGDRASDPLRRAGDDGDFIGESEAGVVGHGGQCVNDDAN